MARPLVQARQAGVELEEELHVGGIGDEGRIQRLRRPGEVAQGRPAARIGPPDVLVDSAITPAATNAATRVKRRMRAPQRGSRGEGTAHGG